MRKMYDAIAVGNVPEDGDLYLGYVDGNYPSYAAMVNRFGAERVVGATVDPGSNHGTVGDGPPDNGTWPEWVAWVQRRRAAGCTPTMYTDGATWENGKAAFAAAGVPQPEWFIADYLTFRFAPPAVAPPIPSGSVGRQYAGTCPPGFDVSVVADHWPGFDPTPPAPPPTPQEVTEDMRYIICTFENGQWAVFATGGQLKRRHISTPAEVGVLKTLGALETPLPDAFVTTLPVAP